MSRKTHAQRLIRGEEQRECLRRSHSAEIYISDANAGGPQGLVNNGLVETSGMLDPRDSLRQQNDGRQSVAEHGNTAVVSEVEAKNVHEAPVAEVSLTRKIARRLVTGLKHLFKNGGPLNFYGVFFLA
jgi:hypothetical protein